ncbi:FYVE-domain-containing protein [Backusella circina FSU 941]|nr:FYVE-domain-containing protein [Backusella circina FSU 941]
MNTLVRASFTVNNSETDSNNHHQYQFHPQQQRQEDLVATWEDNEKAQQCRQCHRPFSLIVRRHHCRRCGLVVCDRCSPHRVYLSTSHSIQPPSIPADRQYLLSLEPQRVCDGCIEDVVFTNSITVTSEDEMLECPVCIKSLRYFRTQQDREKHVETCLNNAGSFASSSAGSIVYSLSGTSILIGRECMICLQEFESDQVITRLRCLCCYHEECIDHWLSCGKECPVHRQ